jgi:hypothetical protein
MTNASVNEWSEINRLLVLFCNATGLMINPHKSSFYQSGYNQVVLDDIKSIFPFEVYHLASGFKYLGYFLKADRYKALDWDWLLKKFEFRITHWCNRWLTLGGRLVLVKAVLESQPVYWLALANIPSSILHRIRQVTYNFLWNGNKKRKGYHSVQLALYSPSEKIWGMGSAKYFQFQSGDGCKYPLEGING